MNTQTKEQTKHYEPIQVGCFWAVAEIDANGKSRLVTEAKYSHGAAKSLADRLNG